jgi:hypothetical protein
MHESMTLLQQVNTFKKSNSQHLIIDRIARQRHLVVSSLNNVDHNNKAMKSLSVDVYANKHLVTNGKSIFPPLEQSRLGELLLPSYHKDMNCNQNYQRRKRKRPAYRKSLFHLYSPRSTEIDLSQLTARRIKPETRIISPVIKDNYTQVRVQHHYAPPPSPSDAEMQRSFYLVEDPNQSHSFSPQSPIETEGYIPFRLPVLYRSSQFSRTSTNSSFKDIRSTLSNYLQKFY